jgi:Mn2+/Fe2+ NRAMP family transporter
MKSTNKISSVILWSVISAAFIGPGTITTAITAGSQFDIQLLWTVVFATIACIVLQEVSARITIASGVNFGKALSLKFGTGRGIWIKWIVALPVLMGCAAYEAGNILGAVSGLSLLTTVRIEILTIVISILVGIVLWFGGSKTISLLMTFLVGLMGIAFFSLALKADYTFSEILKNSMITTIPKGGEWLTIALIGTTIVPYNIFIGSAISKGNTVSFMRIGLIISVVIGGAITTWIMIAGTLTGKFSTFNELAIALKDKMGLIGPMALGVGLFAAGFSSSITSPYAASLIASTVLESEKKKIITAVWMIVLLIGFSVGISGLKPIPVILAVQALNGFVLPLLTYFLILLINDTKLIPVEFRHSLWYDVLLLIILGTTLLIGLNNVDKAIVSAFSLENDHFQIVVGITFLILLIVIIQLVKIKRSSKLD